MAVAKIYPEAEKGGRGKVAANSKESLGFSAMLLSKARAVLRWAPELADGVLAGAESLDATKAAETGGFSEKRIREARAVLRWAPELADA